MIKDSFNRIVGSYDLSMNFDARPILQLFCHCFVCVVSQPLNRKNHKNGVSFRLKSYLEK